MAKATSSVYRTVRLTEKEWRSVMRALYAVNEAISPASDDDASIRAEIARNEKLAKKIKDQI